MAMRIETAVDLINHLEFKRNGQDWKVSARSFEDRFEDTIIVKIEYPVIDSSRHNWATKIGDEQPDGNVKDTFFVKAEFPVMVGCCDDDVDLYREFLRLVALIDAHEAREALRVKPTNWAPFHPHRIDGMRRWGDVRGDYTFGVV